MHQKVIGSSSGRLPLPLIGETISDLQGGELLSTRGDRLPPSSDRPSHSLHSPPPTTTTQHTERPVRADGRRPLREQDGEALLPNVYPGLLPPLGAMRCLRSLDSGPDGPSGQRGLCRV